MFILRTTDWFPHSYTACLYIVYKVITLGITLYKIFWQLLKPLLDKMRPITWLLKRGVGGHL
jgi:hypothetical protein